MAAVTPEAKERARIRAREWQKAHPERMRSYAKKRREKFPEKVKQERKISHEKRSTSNDVETHLEYILTNSRGNAKKRKIKFNLTFEDLMAQLLIQDGKCFYTGVDLVYSTKSDCTVSIDRIDSDGDYKPGNIQFTAAKINIMKNTLTNEQFISICKLISARF